MSDLELTRRAWINECRGWLALGRVPEASGTFEVEQQDGVVIAWWRGDPGRVENNLLVETESPETVAAILDLCWSRITASSTRTIIRVVRGADADQWHTLAVSRGFYSLGPAPFMVCDLRSALPHISPDPQIDIRPALSAADHATALRIAERVYRDPPGLTQFFGAPAVVHNYIGTWAGQAACSAVLWEFSDVAGIYSVATLPEFRRRGLASAIVVAMMREAQQRGLDLAALRTSFDLVPLYERLAYRVSGSLMHFKN
jgi:GNAT superfamily N-acetyltransferase